MSKNPDDKPYIHDNPEDVKDAKSKAKIAALRDKEDTKALMALPAFRRFVWSILCQTHIFKTTFTGNSETFFKEGERNIGLKIFSRLQEHDPDGYALMAREQSQGEP